MRGAFLIVMVIALLIVGLLVMKNMKSEMNDSKGQKVESIQKAKDAAREANEQARDIQRRAQEAARGLQQQEQ